MNERLSSRKWSLGTLALAVPPVGVAILVGATVRHRDWNEPFFVYGTYYILWTMLGVYALVLLRGWADVSTPAQARDRIREWLRENAAGLAATAIIGATVVYGVAPAYRVLADEANLVGVSKNLFLQKTANFAVTGKWYFENYWNIGETTDRRPALFPFLVSLIHTVRGYHAENAFHLNAILFVLFVLSSYRLAKCLGGPGLRGEVFGVAAAFLVAASPNTLVAARSAGFDLLAALLLLVVVQHFYDYARDPSPRALALLSLCLCLLAHVRVEGLGLLAVSGLAVLSLRMFKWSHLRGFGFVYSLIPVFLASRYWQSVAKANDAEQPLSASLFGRHYLVENTRDYLALVLHPLQFDGAHPRLLMIAAGAGCLLVAWSIVRRARAKAISRAEVQLAIFVGALFAVQFFLLFSYSFGQTSQPASVRLFIWLDTLVAFIAAWLLTVVGGWLAARSETLEARGGAALTTMACAALFAMYVPVASDARFMHALFVSRQAVETWRFFEKLGEKRILVLSDRPGLYSIMDYGSLDLGSTVAGGNCLYELSRHLYKDIYLIQEMDIETKEPRPGFASWPNVPLEPVLEFQTTATTFVRIARVTH